MLGLRIVTTIIWITKQWAIRMWIAFSCIRVIDQSRNILKNVQYRLCDLVVRVLGC
jgi:hypothetical protein